MNRGPITAYQRKLAERSKPDAEIEREEMIRESVRRRMRKPDAPH